MKKKIFTMILAGCMVLSMAARSKKAATRIAVETTTAAPEATAAALETMEAAKITFTVSLDQDSLPMGFVGDDDEYTGFDLELAAGTVKRLDLEFVPQPTAWGSKNMELNSGSIDCIWNSFTAIGREDDYTWTIPCVKNDQVFVVTSDSDIESWDDLVGKTTKAQADSSAEKVLQDYPELTASFGTLQTTSDYSTVFMDLGIRNINAIAVNMTAAGYQIGQGNADFVILEEPLVTEEYGVDFKLDNGELRDDIQGALEEIQADGTLRAISEKWFGKDVTTIGQEPSVKHQKLWKTGLRKNRI